jgi:ABC-type lipopolysaccharide export system ATPase subunit
MRAHDAAADQLAVDANGLEKSYGPVRVLDGVDLKVERGSVFALLGPNGAGKTTTVRILATLARADAGQARVAGFDIVADRRRVRRSISLTGQYAAVDELQTGAENLRMMGRLSRLSRAQSRRRARELLERFDLADAGDRRVATYSGGTRDGARIPPLSLSLPQPGTLRPTRRLNRPPFRSGATHDVRACPTIRARPRRRLRRPRRRRRAGRGRRPPPPAG